MIRLRLLTFFGGMLWFLSSPALAAISYHVTDLGQFRHFRHIVRPQESIHTVRLPE